MIAATLLVGSSAAWAEPKVDAFAVSTVSGNESVGGYHIEDVFGGFGVNLDVTASAKWTANINTSVGWEGDDVRQGANLAVTRSAPTTSGSIKVTWRVTGTILGFIPIDTTVSADTTTCAPKFTGGDYECTATSGGLTLKPSVYCSLIDPGVKITLNVTFTVTPEKAEVTRDMTVDDFSFGVDNLDLGTASASESFAMPCTKPADSPVAYKVDPFHWTPSVKAVQQPHIQIYGSEGLFPVCVDVNFFDEAIPPIVTTHPVFDVTGAGHTVDMGELQKNNVNPTVASFPPFSGVEGSPVAFSASTTSACPITGYVWDFSDGTRSFGPSPQRAFGDDAVYNGQLTVTDITGLSGTKSFDVTINNAAPQPQAGPNTSGAWGRVIQFNGQAVDPGWDDQATLVYSWDWGDGTPGTGGANATHIYSAPGNYAAKLTVCDDHTCAHDFTAVTVRTRATLLSYTGPNNGVYSASSTLRAALMDEFGSPVTFGPVQFTLAGTPVGISQTDGFGNAAVSTVVNNTVGTYAVDVAYGGSSLYDYSQASSSFSVSAMSSNITYNGAISGGANKTVTLSAYLTDGLGRSLDGHTVVFTLGTQQATAVTGAAGAPGMAITTLKLNQKNGQYVMSAVWSPTLSESNKWTGASTAVNFAIGNPK